MKSYFKCILAMAAAGLTLATPLVVKARSMDEVGLPYGIDSMYVYKNGKKTHTHLDPNRYTKYNFSGNYQKPFVAKGKLPVLGTVMIRVLDYKYQFKDATPEQKDALGIDRILLLPNSSEPDSKYDKGYAYRISNSRKVRKAILKMSAADLKQFTDAHNSGDKSKLPNQNENLVTDWKFGSSYNFTVNNIKLAPEGGIRAGYMIDEDTNDSFDDSSDSSNKTPKNTAYMDVTLSAKTSRKVGEYDNSNYQDGEDANQKEAEDGAHDVMEKNMTESEKANSSSIEGTGKTTTVHKSVTRFTLHYILVNNQWQLNGVSFASV